MSKSSVKFGLVGSASSLKKGAAGKARPIGSKPAPRRRPPGATAVFDAHSDDEDESRTDPSGVAAVNKRLAAISAKQEKQAKKEYEDALEADPSVFDYDRVYDGMQDSRRSRVAAAAVAHEKEKRQPKYIGNLLKQAKMRAVESDRIFERKLQKEREEQDKLEGEATMKFVTSAYKKKLMEQKKWELQQQLEDEREQQHDVTKTGMSGFYSNLITKNIAMGGDVEKSANSAFTAGSKRHAATDEYEMQDGNAKKVPNEKDAFDETDSNAAATNGSNTESNAVPQEAAPTARMVDHRAASAEGRVEARARQGEDVTSSGGSKARRREEGTMDDARDGAKRVRRDQAEAVEGEEKGKRVASGETDAADGKEEDERREAEDLEKTRKAAAAKTRKDAAVKAARERFLARKNNS